VAGFDVDTGGCAAGADVGAGGTTWDGGDDGCGRGAGGSVRGASVDVEATGVDCRAE